MLAWGISGRALKKYAHLGRTPQDSDLTVVRCALGIFFFFKFSQIIAVNSQVLCNLLFE